MTLRDILTGTGNWLRAHRYEAAGRCEPALDGDGLLTATLDPDEEFDDGLMGGGMHGPVRIGPIAPRERRESIERLQEGFDQLVGQLEQVNQHLGKQLRQHEELMGRVKELPPLLESLPSSIENQKHLTTQLLDQLRSTASKDQQFVAAVERIPAETARQSDTLNLINHQLAAAADTDVQLAQTFVKFKDTMDRLNHNTLSNTEGILQMSKTFAASDRYLKYVVNKLNKRYAWVFAMAMSVCFAVVGALVALVLYLAN
jgi:chromosome segregation ATPase